MGWRRCLLAASVLALALGLASACRTSDGASDETAAPAVVGAAPQPMVEPAAAARAAASASVEVPAPVLPKDTEVAQLISGYSLLGPEECVALLADASCIQRADPVATACTHLKGELKRCDDCRVLCTRPIAAKMTPR